MIRAPPSSTARPAPRGSSSQAARRERASRLEDRLADVVAVPPVVQQDVQVHPPVRRHGLPEVGHQLGVEVPDPRRRHRHVPGPVRPPAQVDGARHERLVHRQDHVPVAADARLVAQRPVDRRPRQMPDVLGRVVGVDVEVALARDRPGRSGRAWRTARACGRGTRRPSRPRPARAVEVERQADVGLSGRADDLGGTAGSRRSRSLDGRCSRASMSATTITKTRPGSSRPPLNRRPTAATIISNGVTNRRARSPAGR